MEPSKGKNPTARKAAARPTVSKTTAVRESAAPLVVPGARPGAPTLTPYVLDSNIHIAAERDVVFRQQLRTFIERTATLCVSTVVVHELLLGAQHPAAQGAVRRAVLEPFRRPATAGNNACRLGRGGKYRAGTEAARRFCEFACESGMSIRCPHRGELPSRGGDVNHGEHERLRGDQCGAGVSACGGVAVASPTHLRDISEVGLNARTSQRHCVQRNDNR